MCYKKRTDSKATDRVLVPRSFLLRVRQASYSAAAHGSVLGYMKPSKNDLLILEKQEYDTVR